MHSNAQAVEALNQVLHKELMGINQYFIHAKMCQSWGYTKLAQKTMEESIEEMKHADAIIERLLFLGGQPNLSGYDPISIGHTVREQLEQDMQLELEALAILRGAIQRCHETEDIVSQALLERILGEEEEHLDWLQAQRHQIQELGYELWLVQQR